MRRSFGFQVIRSGLSLIVTVKDACLDALVTISSLHE